MEIKRHGMIRLWKFGCDLVFFDLEIGNVSIDVQYIEFNVTQYQIQSYLKGQYAFTDWLCLSHDENLIRTPMSIPVNDIS